MALVGLPEYLEVEYTNQCNKFEGKPKMAFVTTFERVGYKKGIAEGEEKGIEKGLATGLYEGIKKAALILLKNGFAENKIANDTGLTLEQVNALKETELA